MLRLSRMCVLVALMTGPAVAQDQSASATAPSAPVPSTLEPAPNASDWQNAIALQIQAFRDGDAAKALSFAGDAFHKDYSDPKAFFDAIMGAGYAPIMQSISQSFGTYRMLDTEHVLQDVTLTLGDQSVYEAIYQMAKEADGWRVYGVELAKSQALGI